MTRMAFRSYDGVHLPHGTGTPAGAQTTRDQQHGYELPGLTTKEYGMDAARLESEAAGEALTERERQILEFERQWWKYAGAKEQAIRDLFDMSATRYYQIINNLIDRPESMRFDPMLVKRLRRMRAARQRARSARRLGVDVTSR